MKTYSTKTNAIRAARTELGSDAVAGLDFHVAEQEPGRWAWETKRPRTRGLKTPDAGDAYDAKKGADEEPSAAPGSTDAKPAEEAPAAPVAPPARKTREGGKLTRLIAMLKRPEGATVAELAEDFGWQPHTTRAAISVKTRKAGLQVTTEKVDGRGRVYRIAN